MTFHGVFDDYLYRAHRAHGDRDTERWRHTAQSAFRCTRARWWERALGGTRARVLSTPSRSVWMQRDDTGRWSVGIEGATFELADLRGLHYLRYLVKRAGIDVHALGLSNSSTGHADTRLDQANLGDVLDATALVAYRRWLSELDAELDAADDRGVQSASTKVGVERDAP